MPRRKRLIRYRKPSLKTTFGVTKSKKKIKKDLGITAAAKPLHAKSNIKRSAKRHIGYESEPMKFLRWLGRLFK